MTLPPIFPDQPELDALAVELRDACTNPVLSENFAEELRQRLTPAWTLKRALGRDPWMRMAAGLLVMSTLAAPVAAMMEWILQKSSAPVVFGFEPWTPPLEVDAEEGWDPGVVPPSISMEDGSFGLSWQNAVELSNRMAQAVTQWNKMHPLAEAANPAPAFLIWDQVSADALQLEFTRRCTLGILNPPPVGLLSRFQDLTRQGDHAEALAGWRWVLKGEGNPADLFAND
jgi:hypothetical protein